MANQTEDQVRDWSRGVLNFERYPDVTSGFGQLTSFKSLGFADTGSPDGWFLPANSNDVAIVVETKRSDRPLTDGDVEQLLKYVRVLETRYLKVVGILTNGDEVRVFRGTEPFEEAPAALQSVDYYLSLFTVTTIDKAKIYELTQRINNLLHYQFAIKNLYHRMIFTVMNPPFEKKYGCVEIVENVLDHVPRGTMCAFIMPDKKLEKESKSRVNRILKHHRLRKIVKLPEDLFFGVGVTTSIFIFEASVPQGSHEVFACYMETDGLVTVKNKGRHDVYDRWPEIEDRWVDIVTKQAGDDSVQWHKAGRGPGEHLSWQVPPEPFTIAEEDFQKVALDYAMFQEGVDPSALESAVLRSVLYASDVVDTGDRVTVSMEVRDGND